MDSKEFKYFRKKLDKTQKQIAVLLTSSLKAVHSYEQGWRNIPVHVERQILFLVSLMNQKKIKSCWSIKKCSSEQKKKCPAWEFRAGKFCWFINGTMCEGEAKKNWREKIDFCRTCEVFNSIFDLPSEFLKTPIPIPLTQI
ncbi:MAG: transcriptional regulator [ANME-2 cluster archaeon]|nr:MAG: transcriptional regulator [ANME-2 cluster archaeon]